MAGFKPGSRPGSYQQILPHDFSKTKKLQDKQQKDTQDLQNQRKLLADRNRDQQRTFGNAATISSRSRDTAISYERYVRNIEKQQNLDSIKQAQTIALNNSRTAAAGEQARAEELQSFINKAINTGVDIYKKIDEERKAQEKRDGISFQLRTQATHEDIQLARNLSRTLVGDAWDQHATVIRLKKNGWSDADIRGMRDDLSEGAAYAAWHSALDQDIALIPGKLNADQDYQNDIINAAQDGNTAAKDVIIRQQVATYIEALANVDPESPAFAQWNQKLQRVIAGENSKYLKLANAFAAEERQDNWKEVIHTTIGTYGSGQPAGKEIARLINTSEDPRQTYNDTMPALLQLARRGDVSYDLAEGFSESVMQANGIKFGVKYDKQFNDLFDQIRTTKRADLADVVSKHQAAKLAAKETTTQIIDSGDIFSREAEIHRQALVAMGETGQVQRLDNVREMLTQTAPGYGKFQRIMALSGGLGIGLNDDKLIQLSGGNQKVLQSMRTQLKTARSNDEARKIASEMILRQLRARGRYTDMEKTAHWSLGVMHGEAMAEWDRVRGESLQRTNGDRDAATADANKDWENKFGTNEFEGKYAVADKTKTPHLKGYINAAGIRVEGAGTASETLGANDIQEMLTDTTGNNNVKSYLKEMNSNSPTSLAIISNKELTNPMTPNVRRKLEIIKSQSRQRGKTVYDIASDIANGRGIEYVKPGNNDITQGEMAKYKLKMLAAFNPNTTDYVLSGTANGRRIVIPKDYVYETYPNGLPYTADLDGWPAGTDIRFTGGQGAPILSGTKIRIISRSKVDGHAAYHEQGTLDRRGASGSGFGRSIAFEAWDAKSGRWTEIMLGHLDNKSPLAGMAPGTILPPGTLIGHQGASGRSVTAGGGPYDHITCHGQSKDLLMEFMRLTWFVSHGGNQ